MKDINLKQSLGHLFHIIHLKMRKNLDKEIREFGLASSHQFGVLLLLSKTDALTQKEISDYTLGDEPSTTRMIARLIKNNLVKKQKNPQDKREQLVSLTSEGQKLLKQITPLAMTNNKKIESLLTKEEYQMLLYLLNKVNDGIKKI